MDAGGDGEYVFGGDIQEAKDATSLILHAKARFAERGKGFAKLVQEDRDDNKLSPSKHF